MVTVVVAFVVPVPMPTLPFAVPAPMIMVWFTLCIRSCVPFADALTPASEI